MTPRKFALLFAPAVLILMLALAACGGGDGDTETRVGTGQLTDPRNVATATPWPEAPEPIILDPDALTPLSGGAGVGGPDVGDGGDGGGDGDAGGEPGVCGDTYTIEAGDSLFAIAIDCGLDPDAVLAANPDVDPGALSIGQVINLPPADSSGSDE
ncbi:MAG: LysM peptidoglycan-binding domain-containing protein [Dehalococcoidia bacterium]